jgi:TonB family protein
MAQQQQSGGAAFGFGGIVVTILLHGAIIFAILFAHSKRAESVIMPRDFMVAKIVRLGKKKPKNLLPSLPAEPVPTAPKEAVKLTDNEGAKATPKTERKPPDAKPGDLSRALAHARMLEQQRAQEDQEGDPNGSAQGNSNTAAAGDLYATAVFKAYNEQWNIPDLAKGKSLVARVRIFVDATGRVLKADLIGPSRNGPFDDSVTEVLAKVKRLPAPPRELAMRFERSGLVLEFVPE